MKSKYLLALVVMAVFLTVSVAPVLAVPEYKATIIVWNRDTHRPLANAAVYLSQSLWTNCVGKPPNLICPWTNDLATAKSVVIGITDKFGKVTFTSSTETDYGQVPWSVWSTRLPTTVWVYDNAAPHYNAYGPYFLYGGTRLPTIIFVNFSTSD